MSNANKIFIKGTEVSENIIRVDFQHFCPLDENEGLTPEQLATGFLVDEIPQPDIENHKGKIPELFYNKESGECFYKYEKDVPLPPITLNDINEKIELLMQLVLENEGVI